MKKKIFRLISCFITLSIILSCSSCMINITSRKGSIKKYQYFFDQEEDFDVLFFGSSVVINSVFPMQLWDEHGIVSYNFGGHANVISTSYWVMKNALDYTNPKLVVIDCCGIQTDERAHEQYQYLHLSLDAFPITSTKYQAVTDLLRDGETPNASMLRTEMLFPFTSYHSRWSELTEEDFQPNYNVEKGAECRVGVATPIEHSLTPTDKTFTETTISTEYLERFITDCQAQGIEVLLIYVPFPPTDRYITESQTIPMIAEKYGVEYVNMLQSGIVDFYTDCYDPDSHLNPSGAEKVTTYLGNFISSHYNIMDHRDNPDYAHWHNDYAAYLEYRQELFANKATNAPSALTLMRENAFDYIIQIDSSCLQNPSMVRLLENLDINISEIPEGKGYILIHKETRKAEYYSLSELKNQEKSTGFGILTVSTTDNATSFILNGNVLYSATTEEWEGSNLYLYLLAEDGTATCRLFLV